MAAPERTSLAETLGPALRRQGWVLVLSVLVGLTLGAMLFATRPARFVASAHIRVGTIAGDRPVIDPLTMAVEGSDASFQRRVQRRAGVQGRVELEGIYHTHLVAVRASAADPVAAVALLDTVCALLVAEQNALIEQMQRDAGQRLSGTGEPVAVVPTLSRPAVRIGDLATARRAGPFLSPLLAGGAGLGIALAFLLGWWRESRRRASAIDATPAAPRRY